MKKLDGYRKGINLGGWLSQCPVYSKEHFDNFIKEGDLEKIANWGMDHVRLPIDYDVIETEDGKPIEEGLNHIEECISWCRKFGLNIVLDLHKTKGYMFDKNAVPDADLFFTNIELQERFYKTWSGLIDRFGKDKDIIIYELLNEVVNPFYADKWNEIAMKAISIIRAKESDARIMVGGVRNNDVKSIPLMFPPTDENLVYTFHCYDPLCFTHQKAFWVPNSDFDLNYPDTVSVYQEKSRRLEQEKDGNIFHTSIEMIGPQYFEEIFAEAVEFAEKYNISLYCGEFGVIDLAPLEDSVRWLRDINEVMCKHGIGRSYWSYKRMDFGITDEHYKAKFNEMISILTTV